MESKLVSTRMPRARPLAALAVVAIATAGCATTQNVRIECVPREVSVYVDGRLLDGREAALRTDRPHKIYAKGPGFEPRLVVIEPDVDSRGRPAFRDDEVCLEVVPIGMGREL